MKLIKSYFDYLVALIEKGSDDENIQKETNNALRILRQYPERYKEYVENKRKGKSLLELGLSVKDIRSLVRMHLTTHQIRFRTACFDEKCLYIEVYGVVFSFHNILYCPCSIKYLADYNMA